MARSKKSDFFSLEVSGSELLFVDSNPAAPRRGQVRELNGSKIRISAIAGLATIDLGTRGDLIAIAREHFAALAAAKAKAEADYAPEAAKAEAERAARLAGQAAAEAARLAAEAAQIAEAKAAAEAEQLEEARRAWHWLSMGGAITIALGPNFADAKKLLDKARSRGGVQARYQSDSRTWLISSPHELIWIGLERGDFLPLSPDQAKERAAKFAAPKQETAHSLLGLPSFALPGDFDPKDAPFITGTNY